MKSKWNWRVGWFVLLGALLSLFMGTVSAQTQYSLQLWNAEYFDNVYLSGNPVYTTTTNYVSFNWGNGSPAGSVPADNFSARYSTRGTFQEGSYEFLLTADDGVHLYVDGRLVIDTYFVPKPGQTQSVELYLDSGQHTLQIDFNERTGTASVDFSIFAKSSGPVIEAPPNLPNLPQPVIGEWDVAFYNNTSLSGSPATTTRDEGPNHNWGSARPLANINADGFSARWSRTQYFEEGRYRFSIQADDGVRLYLNNALLINEWHPSNGGQTYTADVNIGRGNSGIVVEYYEDGGAARISYNVQRISDASPPTATPQPQPPVGQASATVTAYRLNVRSGPSANFDVLTRISQGETYPVVGRNAEASWWQLRIGNVVGWVSGSWVNTFNVGGVPITDGSVNPNPPPPSQAIATVTASRLNVRQGPGISSRVVTRVNRNETYQVVGRNTDTSWVALQVGVITGWVNSSYVALGDMSGVPVTSQTNRDTVNIPPTGYSLQSYVNLRIRSGPSTGFQQVGTIPAYGSASILARNASSTWWYINYEGTLGWVSGEFVLLPSNLNLGAVRVI